VLKDTAQVSAVLGNCTGGAAGQDLVGAANLQNNAITGTGVLIGPNVSRGNLAATGGNTWPLVAGGGFLLAALGLVRLRRRATDGTTEPTTT
jgi:LPXTG-motif cell wall-anchored protein